MNDPAEMPELRPLADWLTESAPGWRDSSDAVTFAELLADRHIYLVHTDHLNDADLIAELIAQFDLVTMSEPPTADEPLWIDLVGVETEIDRQVYFRFYADEEERGEWAKSYPNEPLPPSERPPYDRDTTLPQPANPED